MSIAHSTVKIGSFYSYYYYYLFPVLLCRKLQQKLQQQSQCAATANAGLLQLSLCADGTIGALHAMLPCMPLGNTLRSVTVLIVPVTEGLPIYLSDVNVIKVSFAHADSSL